MTPLLDRSRCPKPVQISGLGTGHTDPILLTEEWLFTRLVMLCNAISFQLFYGSAIYRPVYISIHLPIAFITRVQFAYDASRFHCKLWEQHVITGASNYLYLFVWLKLCFLNSPSIIEHVLNWNAREAWRNYTPLLMYHIQKFVA
jgi:hypothetical protein